MPSCKYSICRILTSIVNEFWSSIAISEYARYFRPRNACCRSDAGYIYALLIFKLPPSGTSDGRFSQD
jgi:hypothetical protein